jgi:hypothetical protein
MVARKSRFINQKDDYSCSAIALYNMIERYRYRCTFTSRKPIKMGKSLRIIKRDCNTLKNGTCLDAFDKAIKQYCHEYTISMYKEIRPTFEKVVQFLQKNDNNSILVFYGWNLGFDFGIHAALFHKDTLFSNRIIGINHDNSVYSSLPVCNLYDILRHHFTRIRVELEHKIYYRYFNEYKTLKRTRRYPIVYFLSK